jgi:hypothetical protein
VPFGVTPRASLGWVIVALLHAGWRIASASGHDHNRAAAVDRRMRLRFLSCPNHRYDLFAALAVGVLLPLMLDGYSRVA